MLIYTHKHFDMISKISNVLPKFLLFQFVSDLGKLIIDKKFRIVCQISSPQISFKNVSVLKTYNVRF